MAQDTLQYHLLILNFIFFLPFSMAVFDSLQEHLFIDFFWKMVIKETLSLPRQQCYFGLKERKKKAFQNFLKISRYLL